MLPITLHQSWPRVCDFKGQIWENLTRACWPRGPRSLKHFRSYRGQKWNVINGQEFHTARQFRRHQEVKHKVVSTYTGWQSKCNAFKLTCSSLSNRQDKVNTECYTVVLVHFHCRCPFQCLISSMVLSYTIRDNFLKPLINKQTEGIEQAGNLVVVKPPILLLIALLLWRHFIF